MVYLLSVARLITCKDASLFEAFSCRGTPSSTFYKLLEIARQVKSAALLVVHEQPFLLVDLRVELHPQPLIELRFLWELYRPQADLYVKRALDPDSVPYPETSCDMGIYASRGATLVGNGALG
jgi:hypothetical protein